MPSKRVLRGTEVLSQGRVVGQVDARAIDRQQAKVLPAYDRAVLPRELLGQQEEQGEPERAGHVLPRLGEGLLRDLFGHAAAWVVVGLGAALERWAVFGLAAPLGLSVSLLLGLVDELIEVGGGEVLVVLKSLQRQAEQRGERLLGVSGGTDGEPDEIDEVQRRADNAQAAQPRRLKKEVRGENMGEELVVLPPQFVVNLATLRVGEHGESSLRNSLVTQGITTAEDSPVNPKVEAIGLDRPEQLRGLVGWAPKIIDTFMFGQAQAAVNMASCLLRRGLFHRIDYQVPPATFQMDNAACAKELIAMGRQIAELNENMDVVKKSFLDGRAVS